MNTCVGSIHMRMRRKKKEPARYLFPYKVRHLCWSRGKRNEFARRRRRRAVLGAAPHSSEQSRGLGHVGRGPRGPQGAAGCEGRLCLRRPAQHPAPSLRAPGRRPAGELQTAQVNHQEIENFTVCRQLIAEQRERSACVGEDGSP